MAMQKITPFLWFGNQSEEAANFYVSIFPNSKITSIARYGKSGPGPEGSVMTVEFEIDGQKFMALNGGPQYQFSPATSFVVPCETQEEVDHFWERLSEGGTPNRCGWLDDKFGVTWQIVPTILPKLLSHPDPEKSKRVMEAMLQMDKLDINLLKRASDQ
jgi:predicted 3-demethylubiquinone-9 3-methyltransferase (glyoxalase superfamily)